MADKNHALQNRDVDGDKNKSDILLSTFMQWSNKVNESPEDCQQIHEKMLALLAQTKFPTPQLHLNNENMKQKKFKALFRVYLKKVNVLKKNISQRKELNISDYEFLFQLLSELKSDTITLEAITKDYMIKNSLRTQDLDELNAKMSRLCLTPAKVSTSGNAKRK